MILPQYLNSPPTNPAKTLWQLLVEKLIQHGARAIHLSGLVTNCF